MSEVSKLINEIESTKSGITLLNLKPRILAALKVPAPEERRPDYKSKKGRDE